MANTAESSGDFQDLLSAALSESGLTEDLDFGDFFTAPASTTQNVGPASAEAPASARVTAADVMVSSTHTKTSTAPTVTEMAPHIAHSSQAPALVASTENSPKVTVEQPSVPMETSTEVDLFSQALQQLTAMNKQAGAFKPVTRSVVSTGAVSRPSTQPSTPVTVQPSMVRPRVAQLIENPLPAPPEVLREANPEPVAAKPTVMVTTPQVVSTPVTVPTVPRTVVQPQPTVVRTVPTRLLQTQSGVPVTLVRTLQSGSPQMTLVRSLGQNSVVRAVQGGKPQTNVVRTIPQSAFVRAGAPQTTVMRTITGSSGAPIQILQQTPQAGRAASPLTISRLITGASANTPKTISMLNNSGVGLASTPTSSGNVTRIPAKIVQQIGPDGTTRTVRIVTVSPGMLQQPVGGKGLTVTKIQPGSFLSGNRLTLQTTAPSSVVSSNAVTVMRPSIVQGQKLTIAPRTFQTIGNKLVMNPTVTAGSLVRHNKVVVTPTRVGSPLTLPVATNKIIGGSRVKVSTPPPTTNSVSTNGVINTQLSEKDVSRLWATDDVKLKKRVNTNYMAPGSPGTMSLMKPAMIEEEAEEEDEELGHAETYADYVPSKLRLGEKHPDSVVETSSMSSVEPPDVWYKVSIPETTIDYGQLSALQLEAITYATQKHEIVLPSGERAGYLIGDGAGVGKGRTIAGIIFENYLLGRKRALWLSVSNDLRVDAERDLRDIGASKIEVHPLNKFKYAKISSKINGSVKKGVVFATYSSLIGESQSGGKYRTRLKQLIHWLGKDFDGLIVFDECHKAKNLCPVGSSKPTKTGLTVLDLQNRLPKARIVYASATGASEPRNMAYMTRLGLWGIGTPFREFLDFINAVEKRGVGAMELVAMDMKLRGMYIARQLSFHGVSFKIEEIPIPKDFVYIYNESVKMWVDARAQFQLCAELIQAEQRMKKSMWGQFWSAHQRFFKYLCISAKVPFCVKTARDAVKNGKCVVIGLQSTGEARTLEQLEENGGELNDFVSTAKGVFQTLVEKHFPAPDRRKTHDMFGLGRSLYDSPVSSPKPQVGNKRKKEAAKSSKEKRLKKEMSEDSDSDSSGPSSPSSESEMSLSESESGSDSGDFNPFGNGSDSDDDPWLKKAKKNKKKKPKEKKKKEKKKKRKKDKKEKSHLSESDDSDIDSQFDQALEAAGLKGNGSVNPFNSSQNSTSSTLPGMDAVDRAIEMKRELLARVEKLGDSLPPNSLDQLIDELGGPESVAEMTGRKGRVVSTDDGIQYESRSEIDAPLEILNLTEKQRFMDGEKNIAIISEAASSGISLQADRRVINQRRRVHITLELPWSADRAVQQFGRTHRSNQVSAPEYLFLISELAGERRFASTVAKRLESLGALTHGDRRATESRDLSRFNIDNKYGRAALETVMKSVLGLEQPIVPSPENYHGDFFADVKTALIGVGMVNFDERIGIPTLEKDYNNISKFLNRILGITVELQNQLFSYFTETLTTIILQAKRNGRWDMGILDLGSGGENVRKLSSKNFLSNFSGQTVRTTLYTVGVERGMTWEKALLIWREHASPEDGFYLSTQVRNGKRTAVLAVVMSGRRRERLYSIYRPNTGLQQRAESLQEVKNKCKKVLPDDAQAHWQDQFVASATVCSHAYWRGNCKRASLGLPCEVGVRCRTYHILGGSVLGCWTKVEAVLASLPGGHASRMQIIRIRTDEGERIVGTLVPDAALAPLSHILSQDITKTSSSSPSLSLQQQQQQQRQPPQQQPQLVHSRSYGQLAPSRASTSLLFPNRSNSFAGALNTMNHSSGSSATSTAAANHLSMPLLL